MWVNWIMQCISTVTYSYLINDAAQGSVKPQRGIGQGDPLSPYLLILCGEVLLGLFTKTKEEGTLRGIKFARNCPQVNHLLFADDIIFFCHATKETALNFRASSCNTKKPHVRRSIKINHLSLSRQRNHWKQESW